jgi:hypothetical protein
MDKKFTIIVRELNGDHGWTTELWDIDTNKIVDRIALQSTLRDTIKAVNEYIRILENTKTKYKMESL